MSETTLTFVVTLIALAIFVAVIAAGLLGMGELLERLFRLIPR